MLICGSETNGFVGRGTVPEPGATASVVGCSHMATNLDPHRTQMNIDLCLDIDFLWYTYKSLHGDH